MKKLFTVSLVAIMAVSAAHADIASTGYVDGKTGNLAFTADTVKNSTNLTDAVEAVASAVESVAGGSIKLTAASAGENVTIDDEGKINVAAPGAGLDVAALENADFVANVSEKDGKITATAGNFHTVTSSDNANTVSTVTVAPTTASIVSYVDTKFGIVDGSNAGLSTRLGNAEGAIENLQTLSGNNADAIEVLNGDAETEGSVAAAAAAAQSAATSAANSYTDGKIADEVSRADAAYDTKGAAAAAQTAANSYTDGKIADEVTRADAAYDTKGAAAAAQVAAKTYTDGLLNVPTACEKGAATCALVYDVNTKGLKWEPIIQLD